MNILGFQKCANCGACYNICPTEAITISGDDLFYAPTVNPNLCIDCSLCSKICPVNQEIEAKLPMHACAGWNKDNEIVLNSSSGGVFYGVAQSVIANGGVVFSAAYSDDCKKVMFVSTDQVPIISLLKSKYVESLVGLSFRKIKEELGKQRLVLVCGTPCQIAGLNSFLGKTYENLITCDFACGGLPSHSIYQAHLEEMERKYCSAVNTVDFRPKTHGWKRYAILVTFQNGKKYNRLGTEDDYLRSFLYGKHTVRDYCLECKFADSHVSDITIADFWLHNKMSKLMHEDGISLILCNTAKGKELLDQISKDYCFEELDVEKASYNNKRVEASKLQKQKHADFLKVYKENGLSAACNTYLRNSAKTRLKNWIFRMVFRVRKV